MKQNKKSSYYILVILFFAVAPLFAQLPEPPSRAAPPVGLPLDGGVLVLFVAAVFYGVKKSIKKK
jgi:hypothetical protein